MIFINGNSFAFQTLLILNYCLRQNRRFCVGYVFAPVCLFIYVCLLSTLHKNYFTDYAQTWWEYSIWSSV